MLLYVKIFVDNIIYKYISINKYTLSEKYSS